MRTISRPSFDRETPAVQPRGMTSRRLYAGERGAAPGGSAALKRPRVGAAGRRREHGGAGGYKVFWAPFQPTFEEPADSKLTFAAESNDFGPFPRNLPTVWTTDNEPHFNSRLCLPCARRFHHPFQTSPD
jgi:hypothetical protein